MGVDMYIPARAREQARKEKYFVLGKWPNAKIIYSIIGRFSM
jgi:hypothetical protein